MALGKILFIGDNGYFTYSFKQTKEKFGCLDLNCSSLVR